MVRQFVLAVTGGLELEGAVFEVEVAREALTQLVQDLAATTIGEGVLGDDDVRGEDGQSAGNRPGVQVVDVKDAWGLGDVLADFGEVDALGGGFQQDVDGFA